MAVYFKFISMAIYLFCKMHYGDVEFIAWCSAHAILQKVVWYIKQRLQDHREQDHLRCQQK